MRYVIYTLQREKETTAPTGFSCNCELGVKSPDLQISSKVPINPGFLARMCFEIAGEEKPGENPVFQHNTQPSSRLKVATWLLLLQGCYRQVHLYRLEHHSSCPIAGGRGEGILIAWYVITWIILLHSWCKVLRNRDNCESDFSQLLNTTSKCLCCCYLYIICNKEN